MNGDQRYFCIWYWNSLGEVLVPHNSLYILLITYEGLLSGISKELRKRRIVRCPKATLQILNIRVQSQLGEAEKVLISSPHWPLNYPYSLMKAQVTRRRKFYQVEPRKKAFFYKIMRWWKRIIYAGQKITCVGEILLFYWLC